MTIGYDMPLYVLPFDHRGSFETGLFGWTGVLTTEQTAEIGNAKRVIYDAFNLAVDKGVPRDRAAILVDAQFGSAILKDARAKGTITCMPVERSGEAEFQFEYGDDWQHQIEAYRPSFVKVLVRYNPEADPALNRRQAARLRTLSDYLHGHGHAFMFELLVPMTVEQSDRLEGDHQLYDHDLRPSLMIGAIKELQNGGVEPDVWKVEGLDRAQDCAKVAEAARRDGRDRVGCIILGRGSNAEKVGQWLRAAAPVPGFIGFAVGRTSFWDALVALRAGKLSRSQAVDAIADRYMAWVRTFSSLQVSGH